MNHVKGIGTAGATGALPPMLKPRGRKYLFAPAIICQHTNQVSRLMARWPAPITTSAFNRLGQRVNSSRNRAYCYTELTVSSLAVAVTITSTYYAYPRRDGQAELAWLA